MRLKLALKVFFLLIIFKSYSNTDKYRVILSDDPSSTITIGWNQISGTDSKVYYDTIDYGTNHMLYANFKTVDRVVDFRGMNNQFARLQNLLPNTNYYFVIKDSENTSQRFWFRTAPADNSRLSFIAGGDSRNNRTPRQKANTLVSKLKPHAVLFGGDMTDDDTAAQWKNWFDDWQLTTSSDGRMIPIIPARGNHEDPDVIYKLFDTSNENSYYALTFGDNLIRTYTLNSEISVLGDQLTWLNTDLSAATNVIWKTAQYHKPMRPHTAGKSEGNSEYDAWARLFYDKNVRLVVDCDSHMAKTTWPIKPSTASGNDEGFIIDHNNGTVYTGEGSWGAPIRANNDTKSWTRNSGSFNQFKLIYVDKNKIELRTIRVNNADDVAELSNDNPFEIPANLDVFSPPTGAVVTILNNCSLVGTPCDDNNIATVNDEEDGLCNCVGLNTNELEAVTFAVSSSSDDAEEIVSTGVVDLTSSDLEFIYDGQDQVVGIRFNNVTLPEGATLYRAYIQFEADETDAEQDPTNLVIYGELAEASSTFEQVANNVSSRIKTATSVSWFEVPLWEQVGEKNIKQRSPYITTIVNEITNQTGWVSGNAVTFIFSGKGKRVAEAIDGTSAPELKLFYQQPCLSKGTSCDDGNSDTYFDVEDGFCNCGGIGVIYGEVASTTGKVWLNRNLGASQVATVFNDVDSYGDLYQWGRGADGHEKRTSSTTTTIATDWFSDEVAGSGTWDGLFIITTTGASWLSFQKDDLWTGTAAENNPCPNGFRVPTNAEFNQERRSWLTNDRAGAFTSPLKLPAGGYRNSSANFVSVGFVGRYWSSTTDGVRARRLEFTNADSNLSDNSRGRALSLRCIKD
jgi:hypothetical protein